MKSLTRTSLVVTALAGLFVCGANTLHMKHKITQMRLDLQSQTAGRSQAENALAEAQTEVRSLSGRLTQTRAELEIAAEERHAAVAAANILKVRLMESAVEKMRIGHERDQARQELARYQAAGLEPEQIIQAALYIRELESSLTKLQVENQVLHKRIVGLQLAAMEPVPELPVDLRAKVLAYDPKWRFMVLDIGQAQGAVPRGEMLVSREGKLVAKVRITRVEGDRCVANLVPNWDLGEVMEGDLAVPAPG